MKIFELEMKHGAAVFSAFILCICFAPLGACADIQNTDASAGETHKVNFFTKGTLEYRLRQFSDAANDLGAALPSEFNNPILHYYYANCMVHLHHKEAAIREYRIAYALQPIGTIGEYCKQCLDRFGIDAEGKKPNESKPAQVSKHDVKRSTPNIPAPPSAAELAALKANPKDGSVGAIEREKTVANLRDLMQQKTRKHGAPIPSVIGTNLFVRNYKQTPPPPAKRKLSLWWW